MSAEPYNPTEPANSDAREGSSALAGEIILAASVPSAPSAPVAAAALPSTLALPSPSPPEFASRDNNPADNSLADKAPAQVGRESSRSAVAESSSSVARLPAHPPASPPLSAKAPPRQLSELPKDELKNLAEDLGLDATRFRTPQLLVAAVHQRRQLIAGFSREAMLDVIRWGRRPVTINATKEQMAHEIARIKLMRFSGLSHRGLQVLARMRGLGVEEADAAPRLIQKLRKQEGLFSRLNRKRRGLLGSIVAGMVGQDRAAGDYQFLPPAPGPTADAPPSSPSIREDIEEAGLFGGITNRLKKNADQYLNQKLDEIEARIDRKLDEIDRRLAEWRDKEIANRIKILKITLWASVIVGIVSLIYSYVTTYILPR